MRTLGIDFGGLVSASPDESGTIAMPLEPSRPKTGPHSRGRRARHAREVKRIVMSLPLEMDGSAGPMAEMVGVSPTRVDRGH